MALSAMVQKIFGLGMGGTGIVAVLVIAGILINSTGNSQSIGNLALFGGVLIGLIFGGFGILGIARRFM